jgi:WD40 repeat protein
VALKVPRLEALLCDEARRRFLTEARAAALLDHPNIVPIREAGEAGPLWYIASAYCEGPTLAEWLAGRREPVPPAEAAALVATLADAVEHMHARGILHRDLKPGNILMASGGCEPPDRAASGGSHPALASCAPKITDFGLAKVRDEAGDSTRTGVGFGTPAYMAPEQATGAKSVGATADVYALGAILYELLAGRPPLTGATPAETFRLVVGEEPPPLRRFRRGVSRDLEAICLKCLQKEPARRYATAAALAGDLRRYLACRPTQARPTGLGRRLVKGAWRRPMTAAFFGLLAVALAAAAAATWTYLDQLSDSESAQSERARHAAIAEKQRQLTRALEYGSGMADLGRQWTSLTYEDRRQRLERLRPGSGEPDPRGFEWFYLWEAVSRPQLQELRGAERGIYALSFSPDGQRLAGLARGEVDVWDVRGGRPPQRLRERSELARGAALRFCPDALRFCPDGGRLVAAPADGAVATIKVWDVTAGRAEKWPETGAHEPAAVSPDGQSVALAGKHPEQLLVQVWDVVSGRDQVVWRRRTGQKSGNVTGLAFSPAGRRLAVAYFVGNEFTVDLVELPGGKVLPTTPGNHYTYIRALAFSPDGLTLAAGAGDSARLCDTATGRQKGSMVVGPGIVSALAFSPDGRTLAAGWQPNGAAWGEACSVSLWDAATVRRMPRELRTGCGVNALSFSPDGRALAVGCFDERVRLWDMGAPTDVLALPEGPSREAWSVAFAPDGQTLAVGYDDEYGGDRHTLQLWDLRNRRVRATLTGHASMVYAVTYTPDGRTVVSAGYDHTVRLWDATTGKLRQTLSGHTDGVLCLARSPDGRTLATGGRDKTVRLWDLATGKQQLPLTGHTHEVSRVAFCPDGRTVASSSPDGTVWVRDVATGVTVWRRPGTAPLTALAYAPDGRTLATGDRTGVIRLWDPATGVERRRLEGHAGEVNALVYSPDGKTLASGGADRTVRLWQAQTGRALLTWDDLAEYPHGLAFSPDGSALAAALHDGTIRVWQAPRKGGE